MIWTSKRLGAIAAAAALSASVAACGKNSESKTATPVVVAKAPVEAKVETPVAVVAPAADTSIQLAGSLALGLGLTDTTRYIYATSLEAKPASSRIEITDGKYTGKLEIKSTKPVDISLVIRENRVDAGGKTVLKDGKPDEVTTCVVEIPNPNAADAKAKGQVTVKPGSKLTLAISLDQKSGACAAEVVAEESTAFDYEATEVVYESIPEGRFQGLWGLKPVDQMNYDQSSDAIDGVVNTAVADAGKYDEEASGSGESMALAEAEVGADPSADFQEVYFLNELAKDGVVSQLEMFDGHAHDMCYDTAGKFAPKFYATGAADAAPLDFLAALDSAATASAFIRTSVHAAVLADLGAPAGAALDAAIDAVADARLALVLAAGADGSPSPYKDVDPVALKASIVDTIFSDIRDTGKMATDNYCATFGALYTTDADTPSAYKVLCKSIGDMGNTEFALAVDKFVANQQTAVYKGCGFNVYFDIAPVEVADGAAPLFEERIYCDNGDCKGDYRPGLVGTFDVIPGQVGSFTLLSDVQSSQPVDVYTGDAAAKTCSNDEHREIFGNFVWKDESGTAFDYNAFFGARTFNSYNDCGKYYEETYGEPTYASDPVADEAAADGGTAALPDVTGGGVDVAIYETSGDDYKDEYSAGDSNPDPYGSSYSDSAIWARLTAVVTK